MLRVFLYLAAVMLVFAPISEAAVEAVRAVNLSRHDLLDSAHNMHIAPFRIAKAFVSGVNELALATLCVFGAKLLRSLSWNDAATSLRPWLRAAGWATLAAGVMNWILGIYIRQQSIAALDILDPDNSFVLVPSVLSLLDILPFIAPGLVCFAIVRNARSEQLSEAEVFA